MHQTSLNRSRTPFLEPIGAILSVICAVAVVTSVGSAAQAEIGVTETEILIGQSSPLTGPSAVRGIQSQTGAEVYLKKINASGGVNGRQIRLLVRDDGYEPQRTIAVTKKFINEDKVFALFQYYGTPTSKAVLPMVSEAKIPFIAAFTGAEVLRNPVFPTIFNVRAAYMDEMKALINFAIDKRGVKEIVLVFQDDAYGTEGKAAAYKAVAGKALKIVNEYAFKRNEIDMSAVIEKIKASKVKHVIAWMLTGQGTDFIQQASAKGLAVTVYGNSTILDTKFCEAVKGYGGEVLISNVLPSLADKSVPLVQNYLQDSKASGAPTDPGAFEGYVNAMVLVEGLKRAGRELTRASLINGFDQMSSLDLHGLKIGYTPDDHRGFQTVAVSQMKNCELRHVD